MLRISILLATLGLITATLSAQSIVGGPVRTLSDTSVAVSNMSFRSNFGAPCIALGSGADLLATWERKAQVLTPGLQPVGPTIWLDGWTRDPVFLPDGRFVIMEGIKTRSSDFGFYQEWRAMLFRSFHGDRSEMIGGKFLEYLAVYEHDERYAEFLWDHQAIEGDGAVISCTEYDYQLALSPGTHMMSVHGKLQSTRIDDGWLSTQNIYLPVALPWTQKKSDTQMEAVRNGASLHRIAAHDSEWIYYVRERIYDTSGFAGFMRYFCIQPRSAHTLSTAVELGITASTDFTRTEIVLLEEKGTVCIIRMDSTLSGIHIERYSREGSQLASRSFHFPYLQTASIYRITKEVLLDFPVFHRADLSAVPLPGGRLAIAWTQRRAGEDPRIMLRIIGSDLEWETPERLLADPSEGKLTLPFLAARNDTLFCAWMTERNSDGAHIPSLKVVTADRVLSADNPPSDLNSYVMLDIHPMPVTDRCQVRVRAEDHNDARTASGTLLVSDLLGRVTLQIPASTGESWIPLDTSGLRPGCYFLRWETARRNPLTRLFLKQ